MFYKWIVRFKIFFNKLKKLTFYSFFFLSFHFVAQCTNVSDIRSIDPNYGVTWMFFPEYVYQIYVHSFTQNIPIELFTVAKEILKS